MTKADVRALCKQTLADYWAAHSGGAAVVSVADVLRALDRRPPMQRVPLKPRHPRRKGPRCACAPKCPNWPVRTEHSPNMDDFCDDCTSHRCDAVGMHVDEVAARRNHR